jgi:hypothetical protein
MYFDPEYHVTSSITIRSVFLTLLVILFSPDMSQMSSKFKGIAGKRKNLSVDVSNKRQKGDTSDATDSPTSPTRSGGKGKVEKKNMLIKLNGPLPKVPADTFINPKARKLFCSVKVTTLT